MTLPWVDPLLFAMTCLGGGGVLFSLWFGLKADQHRGKSALIHVALGILALGLGCFATVAALANQPAAIWGSAGTLAFLYLALVVAPSPIAVEAIASFMRSARSPGSRRGVMIALWVFCPFAALGLVYLHYTSAIASNERLLDQAADLILPTPVSDNNSPLTTDQGRLVRILRGPGNKGTPTTARIEAQDRMLRRFELQGTVIEMPLGWQDTNCHGFVFTAGRYWIGGGQVDLILEDNSYIPVSAVYPGDLAVYRDSDGKVQHTGIARGLASDGVILVESKFGQATRYVHRHDRHPYPDTECTFYRSARRGHLLRGVYPETPGESPIPPSSQPPMPSAPATNTTVGL